MYRTAFYILVLFCCLNIGASAYAQKLHDRHFRFTITLAPTMGEVIDTTNKIPGHIYYDTVNKIVLIISSRESKFQSVDEYLSCSREQLEADLRRNYGDANLSLINCTRSPVYPEKITVLRFRVSTLPFGFDTYAIYFVHHQGHDIQFAFTYKEDNKEAMQHIDAMMRTLKLKKI